jgi:hypothetical protein
MKVQVEIEEGQAAFDRFRRAVKAVLSVPKSALPPRPTRKKKKGRSANLSPH